MLDRVALAMPLTRAQSSGGRLPFPAITGLRRRDRTGWPVLLATCLMGLPELCFPLMRGEIRGAVPEAYSYE